MKRLVCVLLVFAISGLPALATDPVQVKPVRTVAPLATLTPTPEPAPTQDRGSIIDSGASLESIRYVQRLLAGIGALSADSITGVYDVDTSISVANFQRWANANQCGGSLSVSGFVDAPTLKELEYAFDHGAILPTPDPSPTPIPTPTPEPAPLLDFNAVNRNPDKYEGQHFTINGRVLQITEDPYDETDGSVLVGARIATDGYLGDVVYLIYIRYSGEDRLLENDNVTLEGVADGLYSYTSIKDIPVTLPCFILDHIISFN